jgi:hypothetical protein
MDNKILLTTEEKTFIEQRLPSKYIDYCRYNDPTWAFDGVTGFWVMYLKKPISLTRFIMYLRLA